MIDYIHYRLLAWARQGRRGDDGGAGYPRQSIYCRAYDHGHVWDEPNPHSIIPLDELEWWEMERAVTALDAHLCEVVREMYLSGGLVKDKARRLHICENTWRNRLHTAHVQIMDELLEPPPRTARKRPAARHRPDRKVA